MIKVINKYTATPLELAFSMNIMRPEKWGNPYLIGIHGDRDAVVDKHKRWLWEQIKQNTSLAQDLRVIAERYAKTDSLIMYCCCAPKRCHGDNLKAAIEWMVKGMKDEHQRTREVHEGQRPDALAAGEGSGGTAET